MSGYHHREDDGRLRCTVCPRGCLLVEGQRGYCFVRQRVGDAIVCETYGRGTGLAVDPVEKKPLYHFLPGTKILSFGTAGCNLGCRFCQNWHLSHAQDLDAATVAASPAEIAAMARRQGCAAVAVTYNDPVVFLEYAIDTARACHAQGVRIAAVTAGYVHGDACRDLFAVMDTTNVDLKAFDDAFYRRWCQARLEPVLETLRYIRHQTACWLEITTLVIPGLNDDPATITAMARWIADELGPDVPWHLSAFHPAGDLTDLPRTPAATVIRARSLALEAGLHHVYTGNIVDAEGGATVCPACHAVLIERDGFAVTRNRLGATGICPDCGAAIAGIWQ